MATRVRERKGRTRTPASKGSSKRSPENTRPSSRAAQPERTGSAKTGTRTPASGAKGTLAASAVRLAITGGPNTLETVGDLYQKALPKDVLVRPDVVLKRTQAAKLQLAPGDHYYVFDVHYGAGGFTLEASRGSTVLAKKPCSSTPPTGSPFDFTVT